MAAAVPAEEADRQAEREAELGARTPGLRVSEWGTAAHVLVVARSVLRRTDHRRARSVEQSRARSSLEAAVQHQERDPAADPAAFLARLGVGQRAAEAVELEQTVLLADQA